MASSVIRPIFELTEHAKGTVGPGETAYLTFIFSPSEERFYQGEVQITAPQGVFSLPIRGVGVMPTLSATESQFDFGMIGVCKHKQV
jgi:hypothetical protein